LLGTRSLLPFILQISHLFDASFVHDPVDLIIPEGLLSNIWLGSETRLSTFPFTLVSRRVEWFGMASVMVRRQDRTGRQNWRIRAHIKRHQTWFDGDDPNVRQARAYDIRIMVFRVYPDGVEVATSGSRAALEEALTFDNLE
jgi:hypothetical protein